ncbi:MAG: SusC/RagA family TonB-linked outer membrane protein [Bacteroidales bacterium]|nr:SusC/RagA family TonB-linked outer membrane protein [Bacteroidales bacterium]
MRHFRATSLAALAVMVFSFLLNSVSAAAADKVTVTGKISSAADGSPVAGVAVYIPGTNYSAFSNANGEYVLEFVPADKTQISYQLIGYKTAKIAYTGQKQINVVMEDDLETLDDVVVTGYNKIRSQGFTGNTTTVKQEDILKVSPKNVISTLQVFDPSFRLVENISAGSNPNALPEFHMRGNTAVNAQISSADISRQNLTGNNNLPIFILDGFEVSVEKIYDMDPTRITSVTLLKDAAATALYGSRAANGVVVMESKAPQEGKVRVTYNFNLGIEAPDLSAYNLMNSREKLEAEKAAGYFDMNPDPGSQDATWIGEYYDYIKKYNLVNAGVDTDWLSKGVRTSLHDKHSLYVDGGTENIRWGAELKHDKTNGVMHGSNRKIDGASLTLDYRVGRVQILDRVDFDAMTSNEIPNLGFSNFSHLQPYYAIMDPETKDYVRRFPTFGGTVNHPNPLYEGEYMKSFNRNKYENLTNKLSLNWFITDALTLKGQLSLDRKTASGNRFIDPASSTFSNNTDPRYMGSLNTTSSEYFNWDANVLLLYNKQIDKHYINFTSGVELIENNSSQVSAAYTGFPSGSMSSINNAMVITGKPVRSSNKTRLASFLLMANYSWNDIYLLDVSMRADGSSEFGKDKKVAPFWAAGAGLNIHKYDFLKNNKTLSTLKLRASYGQTGKVNFPVYAAKSSYISTSTASWYLTGMGYMMQYLGNEALSWEKTNTIDLGFDLGFLQDRILLKASVYNKLTDDMITTVTLPSSSGFTSYMSNMGKVSNKGVELDLRCNIVNTKDWNVTLFGSLAHNENTILEISDALKAYNDKVDQLWADYTDSKRDASYAVAQTKFVEGGSTSSIFAMKSLGINPANGKEVFVTRDGKVTYDWNAAEQQIVGNIEPKIQGAFGLNARWKNLSLFTSFLYRAGGDQYNYTLVNYVEDVNLLNTNADRRVSMMRWQNPGDVVALKDIASSGYITRPTSRFVQKDNTLQFNSLSLSYDFDTELLHRAKISMLRLTAGMQDLGYWSTIRRERGLEYPYARTFNFSVNLTF